MFVLRTGRQTSRHAFQQRAYATIDTVEEGKRVASTVTPPWSRRFELKDHDEDDNVGPARRTVCIRTSRLLAGGMVDAFAVIRGMERKFGRIREYRFIRDGEVNSEYQMICWAAFQSEDSMSLIPEEGITMNVMAVTQDPTIPEGGPGLEHLQGLFDVKDTDSSSPSTYSPEGPSTHPRLIELNVQRAASDLRFNGDSRPLNLTKGRRIEIGQRFYEWGGFYPLKPLYTSSPFASPSEELPPTPDHEKMRIALNKWSQILERPDPSFAQMEATATAEADTQKDMTADSEPPSDSSTSTMLSQRSRRKTRREVDSWVSLSTPQLTKPASPPPEAITLRTMPKTLQPSTPKVSRKERLLEQARSQARERVLQQVALRAREAESADLENPNSETLRESVEAFLKDSKVDADSPGNVTDGSEYEVKPKAGDKPLSESQASPAQEKLWNLVGKWF